MWHSSAATSSWILLRKIAPGYGMRHLSCSWDSDVDVSYHLHLQYTRAATYIRATWIPRARQLYTVSECLGIWKSYHINDTKWTWWTRPVIRRQNMTWLITALSTTAIEKDSLNTPRRVRRIEDKRTIWMSLNPASFCDNHIPILYVCLYQKSVCYPWLINFQCSVTKYSW